MDITWRPIFRIFNFARRTPDYRKDECFRTVRPDGRSIVCYTEFPFDNPLGDFDELESCEDNSWMIADDTWKRYE